MKNHKAFTLVELLVVISIIALLLSVLMPALSKARTAGKAVVCAVNLKTLALGTALYAQANNDKFVPLPGQPLWYTYMLPYIGRDRKDENGISIALEKYLLCPEAPKAQPSFYVDNVDGMNVGKAGYGGARCAWGWAGISSYAMNAFLCPFGNDGVNGRSQYEISARQPSIWPFYWQSGKMSNAPSDAAIYGDGKWAVLSPNNTSITVSKAQTKLPAPQAPLWGGLDGYIMDRHGMAVNIAFVGGQVNKIALTKLGQLRWSKKATPGSVVIR